ncbi:MAG: phosphoribosylanthranilate isomerase [Mucilaginibacter sp.]
MKIKVCGLKYPENIRSVAGLAPDFMGFIFYDKTPRFAGGISADILNELSQTVIKTGVFVNESLPVINSLINKYGFNAVQLHGSESPEFCAELKDKVKVIKAFGVNEDFNFEQLKSYAGNVDFFLFDTKTPIHGGSGKTFDWGLLDKYQLEVPFFLSGGISPENLEEIKKIKHPRFYGVDLNSRFETEPGLKDIMKLEKAFEVLKTFDTNEIRS